MDKLKEFFEKTLPDAVHDAGLNIGKPVDHREVATEADQLHHSGEITAQEHAQIQATLLAMDRESGRSDLVEAAHQATSQAMELAAAGYVATHPAGRACCARR